MPNNPPNPEVAAPSVPTTGVVVVIAATVITWALLVLGTLHYVTKDTFVELATKIILPLYKSTIVAVLSYVFGKPVMNAFACRLTRPQTVAGSR